MSDDVCDACGSPTDEEVADLYARIERLERIEAAAVEVIARDENLGMQEDEAWAKEGDRAFGRAIDALKAALAKP